MEERKRQSERDKERNERDKEKAKKRMEEQQREQRQQQKDQQQEVRIDNVITFSVPWYHSEMSILRYEVLHLLVPIGTRSGTRS